MRRIPGLDLLGADLVVSHHLEVDMRIDLAQTLDEVIREGIVIVDQDDHGRVQPPARRREPPRAELAQ